MTESQSRSILKRLSNISKEKGVPYQYILTEFLIERMVVKLMSSTSLSRVFVFKGGYVGRRTYGSPRYTIDLDALLQKGHTATIEQELISTLHHLRTGAGQLFRFVTNPSISPLSAS